MNALRAIQLLDRALDLQRRAASNRAKFYRAGVVGKSAAQALERADQQSEQADQLFSQIRQYLEAR